jgi:P27 family predicted phage terminase small subunit
MRGRKPKPPEQRQRRNRIPEPGPEPELQLGPCPAWLSASARAEWVRLAGALEEARAVTGWDRALFADYCSAWGAFADAEAMLKKLAASRSPKGKDAIQAGMVTARRERTEAHERMVRLAAELRLSPVSRFRAPIQRRPQAPPVPAPKTSGPTGTVVRDPRLMQVR